MPLQAIDHGIVAGQAGVIADVVAYVQEKFK